MSGSGCRVPPSAQIYGALIMATEKVDIFAKPVIQWFENDKLFKVSERTPKGVQHVYVSIMPTGERIFSSPTYERSGR